MKDKHGKNLHINDKVMVRACKKSGSEPYQEATIVTIVEYGLYPYAEVVFAGNKTIFARYPYETELISDTSSSEKNTTVVTSKTTAKPINDCLCPVCRRSCAKIEVRCWWCDNLL